MLDPRPLMQELIEQRLVTVDRVWASYWGEGGCVLRLEFETYLYGAYDGDPIDQLIITWAVDELALKVDAVRARL